MLYVHVCDAPPGCCTLLGAANRFSVSSEHFNVGKSEFGYYFVFFFLIKKEDINTKWSNFFQLADKRKKRNTKEWLKKGIICNGRYIYIYILCGVYNSYTSLIKVDVQFRTSSYGIHTLFQNWHLIYFLQQSASLELFYLYTKFIYLYPKCILVVSCERPSGEHCTFKY